MCPLSGNKVSDAYGHANGDPHSDTNLDTDGYTHSTDCNTHSYADGHTTSPRTTMCWRRYSAGSFTGHDE